VGEVCVGFIAGCVVIVPAWIKKITGLIRDVDVLISCGFRADEHAFSASIALFEFSLTPLGGWSYASPQ